MFNLPYKATNVDMIWPLFVCQWGCIWPVWITGRCSCTSLPPGPWRTRAAGVACSWRSEWEGHSPRRMAPHTGICPSPRGPTQNGCHGNVYIKTRMIWDFNNLMEKNTNHKIFSMLTGWPVTCKNWAKLGLNFF